jgi:hypothetical protein
MKMEIWYNDYVATDSQGRYTPLGKWLANFAIAVLDYGHCPGSRSKSTAGTA